MPVGTKHNRNISRPKQNLFNIFKTKKIKNITSMKNQYIRSSNKISTQSNSKTSSLPRIKLTDKQKNTRISIKSKPQYKHGK